MHIIVWDTPNYKFTTYDHLLISRIYSKVYHRILTYTSEHDWIYLNIIIASYPCGISHLIGAQVYGSICYSGARYLVYRKYNRYSYHQILAISEGGNVIYFHLSYTLIFLPIDKKRHGLLVP